MTSIHEQFELFALDMVNPQETQKSSLSHKVI